jgi:hypothetical protein
MKMPVQKLKDYLDEHDVRYVTISHSPAYTAQRIAELTRIPGKELAKTVIVKIDGQYAMAVLPASRRVDLDHLKSALGADKVVLASEDEFKRLFPDCELGAADRGRRDRLQRGLAYRARQDGVQGLREPRDATGRFADLVAGARGICPAFSRRGTGAASR